MPRVMRNGFAAIRPTSSTAYAPDIGRGTTPESARHALATLLEQQRRSPIEIFDIRYSNTVEEAVIAPDIPCVGRVWHVLAAPLVRYLYDEWLEEGGCLIREVIPLTWGFIFREGILCLAPKELATIDCEWEWAERDPASWPPAVAYVSDEAGRAAILLTHVGDPGALQRLQHGTPVRQTAYASFDDCSAQVDSVQGSAPLMLEAALGYPGHAAKVAFSPDHVHRTLSWWDRWDSGTGSWENWCTFLRYLNVRSSWSCRSVWEQDTPEAQTWLVLDRQTRRLYTGTKTHARRYLRQDCIVDARMLLPTKGEPETLCAALQSWVDAELTPITDRSHAISTCERPQPHLTTPANAVPATPKNKAPRKGRQHVG